MRAPCLLLLASGARAVVETPWTDFTKMNLGQWRGRAVRIDPRTAEPRSAAARFVVAHAEAARPCTYSTRASLLDGTRSCEFETTFDERADVDLDGSYSNDHPAGCAFTSLFSPGADGASEFVIEHSIAWRDDARLRLLLRYGPSETPATDAEMDDARPAPDALLDVLLLDEVRASAGSEAEATAERATAATCTVYSLLGEWRGDACVRQPERAPAEPERAPPRGFGAGGGGGGKARARAPADARAGGAARFGRFTVNVFKASVRFTWDGGSRVGRRLGFASFAGEPLDAISTTGILREHAGEFESFEAIDFASGTDPTAPRMLLLPNGCYVLAPSTLARGAPFATEFGALLEGGESFGWMGHVDNGDSPMTESGAALVGGDDPAASRMVRVQRLYGDGRVFASGTTSLCTEADGDGQQAR